MERNAGFQLTRQPVEAAAVNVKILTSKFRNDYVQNDYIDYSKNVIQTDRTIAGLQEIW